MNFNFSNVFQSFQTSTTTDSSPNVPTPRSPLPANLGYYSGQAIVEQIIQPGKPGRVRFKGSRWFARCDQPVDISPHELVDVIGIQNITLLVEPAFLLSASYIGLIKVRQVIEQRSRIQGTNTDRQIAEFLARELLSSAGQNSAEAIAPETWQRFIQGKPIYIKTFQTCCEVLDLPWKEVVGYGDSEAELEPADLSEARELQAESEDDLSFVGRDMAIADLQRLVDEKAQIITILGEGGIGKTVLAQQYFSQAHFDMVLECWMAKETQNITSAEGVVLAWLQKYFEEEAGRTFAASLEQLRRHLQAKSSPMNPLGKVGVLIDNLEPALDRQGQILPAHRGYAALLEVLADPVLDCVTLITSREPMHEPTIAPQIYTLSGLDETAWRQFFGSRSLPTDSPALAAMHQAYSGNAKAMTILSSAISVDYGGDIEAFWRDHQTNLLDTADLEDLVSSHFTRLQQIYPEAYTLLCRMGCCRFQDVATVPVEVLYCLLWDVPALKHRSIVRFLRDLFLVEVDNEEYRLHPVIQAKALAILRANPQEWDLANRKAADFWTERVTTIATVEDAMMAAEAYRHYVQIEDWDSAAAVILYGRDCQWQKSEPLGISFYRLGLLQRMINAITRILDRLQPGYPLCKLYNILGDLYWLTGNLQAAIGAHQKSRDMAIDFQLKDLEIQGLFNIGLCKLSLWELPEAEVLFEQANAQAENTEWHMYAVGCWFCLALLKSVNGRTSESLRLVERVLNEYAAIGYSAWSRGYSLLFLGGTLRNIGDAEQAQKMYELAKKYAEQSRYTQVKAEALNGLAMICRSRQDFKGAVANHLAAKRLLDRIEAKGDLAEVNYQLGLTYRQMNELAESRNCLQKAIELFQQMNAPRQVQRVQQVLSSV
ncbi:MAG TPA: tetratricopeptide repeat protein [Coleofasciculaceae cyanobacterium]